MENLDIESIIKKLKGYGVYRYECALHCGNIKVDIDYVLGSGCKVLDIEPAYIEMLNKIENR